MQMLDLAGLGEEGISLAAASELVPRKSGGKRISIKSIERWIRFGYRGVFLEATKIAGSFYTSAQAVRRFEVACCTIESARCQLPSAASTAVATAPAKRARKSLEKAGWAPKKQRT